MFAYIDSIYSDYQIFQKNNDWAKDRAKKFIQNPENLETCMQDPSIRKKIDDDVRGLFVDGISYTPSIGIFYDGKLVWRYASWLGWTMRVMDYLATFWDNADQFWSDALFNKIQKMR
jgi:protein-disulfide isomerase